MVITQAWIRQKRHQRKGSFIHLIVRKVKILKVKVQVKM